MGHTATVQKSESVLRTRQSKICFIENLEIFIHLKFGKKYDFGPFQNLVLHQSHVRWKLL